jgi:Alcohol dehydrogenase GroES-like domain
MGHKFIGIVEAVESDVRTVKKSELVVAPFAWSDGTCEFCEQGLQTSCLHGMVGRSRARGRTGRSRARTSGGQDARRAPRGARPCAHAVAPDTFDTFRRDGHGPPRGACRQGPARQCGGCCRRRCGWPVRRHRRPSARCRADQHAWPPRRPDRARTHVRRNRCRQRAWGAAINR